MTEQVDHPKHYAHPSGVECIDLAEVMNFNLGNALKYLWRAGFKDSQPLATDLAKAAWYIRRHCEQIPSQSAFTGAEVASTRLPTREELVKKWYLVESHSDETTLLGAFMRAVRDARGAQLRGNLSVVLGMIDKELGR